jgi:hypothetical protein
MTAQTLINRAAGLGLRLEPRGDKLAVIPAQRCPPDFAAELRQHKCELLDWFEAQAAGLAPDCAAWHHVARQILAGEFEGADGSTIQSLNIGLRGIVHPICQQAINHLKSQSLRRTPR